MNSKEDYQYLGKSILNVNAAAKATGRAKYCTDMELPRMLYGKVLRSPYPHARILSIDTSEAERLDGVKVVIVGDILHSRVARSNIWCLTTMGAEVVLCGPPTLLSRDLMAGDSPWDVRVETNLDKAIEGADVVMALRIQKERQGTQFFPSLREYSRLYQVNEERLKRAADHVVVMHPGPMNEGIEISHQVAHGMRSLIEEQVSNGVAVRMALLYLLSAQGNWREADV